MNGATREQIMGALQTLLASAFAPFGTTITRRNRSPETIASPGSPALVLVAHEQEYDSKAPNLPAIRSMMVDAIVYVNAGPNVNAIPDALLNPILDALESAIQAPDYLGRQTLGKLVYSVVLDGRGPNAPGDKTGLGLGILPLKIVIP
jgi:hypothetical protein